MGKSTISMAIFHCYVSSPEGISPWSRVFPSLPGLSIEFGTFRSSTLYSGPCRAWGERVLMECMGKENYEKVQEIELPEMMLVCNCSCVQMRNWPQKWTRGLATWIGRTPSMIQTHVALCREARVRRCEKIMIQELIKVSRFFFQWDPAAKIIFAMGLQSLLYTPDSFCHSGRSCKHDGRAQLRTCAAMKTGVSLWICSILERWRWRLAYRHGNALKDSSAYGFVWK